MSRRDEPPGPDDVTAGGGGLTDAIQIKSVYDRLNTLNEHTANIAAQWETSPDQTDRNEILKFLSNVEGITDQAEAIGKTAAKLLDRLFGRKQ